MAWPRNTWITGEALAASDLNAHANAFATWGGAVNAGGYNLSNLGDVSLATGKKILQATWTNLASALANSWAVDPPWAEPACLLDKQGFVHLEGVILSGTFTDNTTILTIPVGFRPATTQFLAVLNGWIGNVGHTCKLNIATNGVVTIEGAISGYLSLCGITYQAA